MKHSLQRRCSPVEAFQLTGIVFVLAWVGSYPHPAIAAKKILDQSVSVINDEVILESDVTRFQKKIKSKSYEELFGAVDPRALTDRKVAHRMLIEEKLINQQVKKLDLAVSDQELEGQLKAIQKRNGITPEQLVLRLKQLDSSMAEYREGIRRQIERRNLVEREIKPNLEIPEDQLRNFFIRTVKPNPSDKQYKIAHIFFDAKRAGNASAGQRALAVWKELSKNAETFENATKEFSDDKETAETGGVLGFFKSDQLSAEFRAVVPSTTVGGITKPIKVATGFHIVKVLGVGAVDFDSLSKEQKEVLRNQMVGEELERRMTMWLERKKGDAFIRINKE